MRNPIDVTPAELEMIMKILNLHVPEFEVRVFGSRVNGNSRPTSDIDLVVMTDTPLPILRLIELKEAFTESNLPFRVDVLDWARIGESFRTIIEKSYAIIQEGNATNTKSAS